MIGKGSMYALSLGNKLVTSLERLTMKTALSTASAQATEFPVTSAIKMKLNDIFDPIHLDVMNESHMHNV